MKIRFILNPKSGTRAVNQDVLKQQILARFPDAELCLTTGPGHATELAHKAAAQHIDAVVAMGGDGTINETAKGLVHTQTALGIIPRGSGTGFARELGMMGTLEQALGKLQHAAIQPCDIGFANGELFLNLAGVGIEAAVAWQFMEHGKKGSRGMLPYFKLAAQTFFSYKPNVLRVSINGKTHRWAPLTLVFANNRQYGSNFIIAPQAGISDGKLEMVIVQPVAKYKLALAVPFFFLGNKPPFGITATAPVQSVVIESDQEILYHIDGEPRKTARHLEITMTPQALRLLVP